MLIFNEDSDFRFYSVEAGTMTAEKLNIAVDTLKGSRVGMFMLCANGMKANYPSMVLDSYTDGFDANLGMDQPCFNGEIGEWGYRRAANIQALESHGIDSNAYLLKRARDNGLAVGMTIRMADHHGFYRKKSLFMSKFYLEHPELRLKTTPPSQTFDFTHAEVRDLMVRAACEIMCRYPTEYVELDWLRHLPYFEPGEGAQHRHFLTEMVEAVREKADWLEKVRGHKIRIYAVVPSTYDLAVFNGIDGAEWANRKLVDMLILAPTYLRDCTIDADSWKAHLDDPDFPVGVRIEHAYQAYPGAPEQSGTMPEMKKCIGNTVRYTRGAAWSAYCRGAKDIEFFNYNRPRDTPEGAPLFADCSSKESLLGKERWFMISYNDLDMPYNLHCTGWRQPGVFPKYIAESLADGSYPYQLPRPVKPGKTEKFVFPSGPVPEKEARLQVCFTGVPQGARVTLGGAEGVFSGAGWDFPAGTAVSGDAEVGVTNTAQEEYYITEAVLKVLFPGQEKA
ncbi:MAG: hypothetical protein IJU70_00445 [Lentisphaeria bacterium]|nr:hypothetical protein [Lentisphaeria bacterium]